MHHIAVDYIKVVNSQVVTATGSKPERVDTCSSLIPVEVACFSQLTQLLGGHLWKIEEGSVASEREKKKACLQINEGLPISFP